MGEEMLLDTVRRPMGILSAMLFSGAALLLGFGIGLMISQVLPDIIRIIKDLG